MWGACWGACEILDDKAIATPPEGEVAMALVVDRHVSVAADFIVKTAKRVRGGR